jgi:hypothetical protein
MIVKLPVGTASRGTWIVSDDEQFEAVIGELADIGAFREPVIVQEIVDGEHRQSQAIFSNGRLIASHAYRQIARGAGGGSSIKESVSHAPVDHDLARLGEYLSWHGALSVDYVVNLENGRPSYFDCNPRLVEPMSALLAGLDLVDLLLQVSRDQPAAAGSPGASGVRTHLALQALLGCAAQDESRVRLLRECRDLLFKRGPYDGSLEELTPVSSDWPSFVPLAAAALWLLATPAAAHYLPRKGWGAQLLTPESIRIIAAMDVGG